MARTLTILLLLLGLWPGMIAAAPLAVTSDQLIEAARSLDQAQVVYTGEVIGEALQRNGFVWINVYDGANAVGVRVADPLLPELQWFGRYDSLGDRVQVTGKFERASAENGGDFCIVASAVQVVQSGHALKHPVNPAKAAAAWLMFGLAGLLVARALFASRFPNSRGRL